MMEHNETRRAIEADSTPNAVEAGRKYYYYYYHYCYQYYNHYYCSYSGWLEREWAFL